MQKENRWAEDTTIVVRRDCRARLKMLALKKGQTLVDFLDELSYGEIKNERYCYGDVKTRKERVG